MPDFHQSGIITTLHRLAGREWQTLEAELLEYGESRPIALVLPCLYSELEGPALNGIVEELAGARYVAHVVVAIGRADREQFAHACAFFSRLPQKCTPMWMESEGVRRLVAELEDNGLHIGPDGKGRSCWLSYGFALAHDEIEVIAQHDCDVLTYDRELLVRLCYPVGNPTLGFEFAKGYYARYSDRLHGRAVRLLMTPLMRAIERVCGPHPLLTFLDSFRYPLAGEFAMSTDLARVNRIPGDWGLEIGVLAEIYRNLAPRRVCQVDLCERYDHKHQALSAGDASQGLMKMAVDIAKSVFRNLATEGVSFGSSEFRSLTTAYVRLAEDAIRQYSADAEINALFFDRHEEGLAVETFARSIQMASQQFMEDPMGVPLIPNWNRVISAIPDFLDRLRDTVEDDLKSVEAGAGTRRS